jgi:hypothetical protein
VEHVEEFRTRFEAIAAARITDEMTIPTLHIDAEIDLERIGQPFVNLLKQFGPFGPGNMSPVFVSRGLRATDVGWWEAIGRICASRSINRERAAILCLHRLQDWATCTASFQSPPRSKWSIPLKRTTGKTGDAAIAGEGYSDHRRDHTACASAQIHAACPDNDCR